MYKFESIRRDTLAAGHEYFEYENFFLISPSIDIFKQNNPYLFNSLFSKDKSNPEKFDPNEIIGQFLIIEILNSENKESLITKIISDCFASIPCYFNKKGRISLFPFYEERVIDNVSIIDYLLTRRISAGYSFYKHIFRIESSQVVVIAKGKIDKKKYFLLEVDDELSLKDNLEIGSLLSKYLGENIFRLKSKEICSYFSGGLDSRFILASGLQNISKLFTVGFSKDSREIDSAIKVSDLIGKSHTIDLGLINDLEKIHKLALFDSRHGVQTNSLFRMFDPPRNYNYICGIGLDYLFQGMYTNFNLKSYLRSDELEISLFNDFLKNTISKNRGFSKSSLNDDCKSDYENIILEISKRRLQSISESFRGSLSKAKVYDLFLFSTPSAHYTFSDYLGMMAKATTFIPLCDKRFLTLFASIPDKARNNRIAMRCFLKSNFPALYNIPDANIGGGFQRRFIDRFKASIKSKLFQNFYEDHELRTFPLSSFQILRGPCRNLYRDLIHQGNYDSLGISKEFVINQLSFLNKNPKSEDIADNIHTIYTLLSLVN